MAAASVHVLVDAENLSSRYWAAIERVARAEGTGHAVHLVGDWRKPPTAEGWRKIGEAHGHRLVHQDRISGKNSADIALAILAMDLLADGARHFVIASSDGDFAALAARLARSAKVVGVGREGTPKSFQRACSAFVVLTQEDMEQHPHGVDPNALDDLLRIATVACAKGPGGWASAAQIGNFFLAAGGPFEPALHNARGLMEALRRVPGLQCVRVPHGTISPDGLTAGDWVRLRPSRSTLPCGLPLRNGSGGLRWG